MRHPSNKHNVARLRAFLKRGSQFEKFDQEQFADLIGCSVNKLQNIETGRTKLDEDLARKISNETGIACRWLLENNTKAPLIAAESPVIRDRRGRFSLAAFKRAVLMHERGVPYTIEAYNHRRSMRDIGVPLMLDSLPLCVMYAAAFYGWLRAIYSTKDGDIALWKTGRFLEQLASEYGHNRDILSTPYLKVAPLENFKVLREQTNMGMRLAIEDARRWRMEWPEKNSAAKKRRAKKQLRSSR
jgi:transcriptional regulator with XRE-family HTH domain